MGCRRGVCRDLQPERGNAPPAAPFFCQNRHSDKKESFALRISFSILSYFLEICNRKVIFFYGNFHKGMYLQILE